MSTVVALRALGLGDAITGLPALHLLRAALPGRRLVVVMPQRLAPVVDGVADEIVDSHELAPLPPLPAPEVAIDLHGNGPASRRLLEPLGAQHLIAYAGGPHRWDAGEHEVARWVRLVREGVPTQLPAPPLGGVLGAPPDAGADRGATVVHCGAASASRRWQEERLAALALLLHANGHRVVVTGDTREQATVQRIARAANVHAETDLSLPQLMELVGTARLVVSGDTGVAHLASAYRRPSVTLCGPVDPARWGPPPLPRHRVLWHGDGRGDPHGDRIDPALARITVAEAAAAAREALQAAGHGG